MKLGQNPSSSPHLDGAKYLLWYLLLKKLILCQYGKFTNTPQLTSTNEEFSLLTSTQLSNDVRKYSFPRGGSLCRLLSCPCVIIYSKDLDNPLLSRKIGRRMIKSSIRLYKMLASVCMCVCPSRWFLICVKSVWGIWGIFGTSSGRGCCILSFTNSFPQLISSAWAKLILIFSPIPPNHPAM